jgi:putative DNA primase/helicase
MADLTQILGGPWKPPSERVIDPPELQLRKAMLEAGLTPPDQIWLDGKVHRFASGTKGKPGHGDKPGWYVAYSDGVPAGRFGCWRLGVEVTWKAEVGRQLTMTEHLTQQRRIEEAKAARDAEQARKHEVAASTVQLIWSDGATASPDHPYLQRKGIKVHGARVTGDGRLMVPLYTPNGELSSLQYISADGDKKYHSGGATGGCYWWLGAIEDAKLVYVAEGFATAATIHEATGQPVFVAYSASNLVPVTGMLRDRINAPIVIVADNDASGVGQRYAEQASAKYGARFIVPPIEGDANDYVQAGHNLSALLTPAQNERYKLIRATELSAMPSTKWRIKGVLPAIDVSAIYGPPGTGKSFLALDMGAHIAEGADWQGYRTKQATVVYVVLEAATGFTGRLLAWEMHNGRKLPDNFYIVAHSPFAFSSPADIADLTESIRAMVGDKHTGLVVFFDTLARAAGDFEENENGDQSKLATIAETMCRSLSASAVLVAHPGKDSAKGIRGGSALPGALETIIKLEKDTESSLRTWTLEKQKEGMDGIKGHFTLHPVVIGTDPDDGDEITSAVVVPAEADEPASDTKKETKGVSEARRMYEGAALSSYGTTRNGRPFVSAYNWSEWTKEREWKSDGARRTAIAKAKRTLLEAAYIFEVDDGYSPTDWGLNGPFMGAFLNR